jgi:hypothetical protein
VSEIVLASVVAKFLWLSLLPPRFVLQTKLIQKSITFDHGSQSFYHAEDVNGDKIPDLACHFYKPAAAFRKGDTQGFLKGRTFLGAPLFGTDSLRIVDGRH